MNGGIARCSSYIIEYLKNYPVDVDTFKMDTKYLGENAPILKRIIQGVKSYTKLIGNLKNQLKILDYQVVHICSSGSLGLIRDYIFLLICEKYSVKGIIHFHFGRIPQIKNANNWEWKLLKKVISKSDKVIVMNKQCDEALKEYGDKIFNIPNPLSPIIEKLVRLENSQFNANSLVFVGHILPTKGINELLSVIEEITNVNLTIIGSDTFGIMAQHKQLHPELYTSGKIKYLGEQPIEVVIHYMSMGCFIFPSYSEGFPNVILESMACGVPIIASQVGAIPEMLNVFSSEPCGICVPPKDPIKLKEAILDIISNKKKAECMGNNAKLRVREKFNIKGVVEKLLKAWA